MQPRQPRNSSSSTTPSTSTAPTRHGNTLHRRRVRRARVIGIAGMAATAVVGCTGFAWTATSGTALGLPTPTATATHDVTVTEASGDRVSVHAGSAVSRSTADSVARSTLATGEQIANEASGKVAMGSLTTSLASLSDYRKLSADTVIARAATAQNAAQAVGVASLHADQRAAAALIAAQDKAAAVAQEKADAARQATANTPDGAKATAKALMSSEYGWGSDQYSCLVSLWTKESGWNYQAYNASGATGIPQALPGSKMATVASDWSSNATTQVIWGLRYISGSYGTPCAAWSHSQSVNWY